VTPPRCASCDAPLAADQRYCLECGTRRDAARDDLRALLTPAARPVPEAPAPRGFTPLARARAAALVVLAIGVGSLIGAEAGPRAPFTLAASRVPLTIVLPPRPEPPAPVAAPEPPATDAEPTPEPAADDVAEADATAVDDTATEDTTGSDTTATDDSSATDEQQGAGEPAAPEVKHVFLITLADQPVTAFAPDSPARYLAGSLVPQGTLLDHYYAVTRGHLANRIAMLSGQGPTLATQADCPDYRDVAPAVAAADAQETGRGCVYSPVTGTLPDQLTGNDKRWRSYVEGMDRPTPGTTPPPPGTTPPPPGTTPPPPGTTPAPTACRHPAAPGPDPEAAPRPGDPYVTWTNPLVYFHTILDGRACADDVDLATLETDLATAEPDDFLALALVSPQPSTDPDAADAFLRTWIPRIRASAAYADGGLIVITSDQAPTTGTPADTESCCARPDFPNDDPAAPKPAPGGGRVGLLLLSKDVERGKVVDTPYDHFSLLATLEDLFGLPRLGYTTRSDVEPFDPAILSGAASDAVTTR